jgi:hypothetical protein
MADILQCFPINAPLSRVFGGISHSKGLDQWWTKSSKAEPEAGISTYCWAMYLRILKRWLEFGEQVPYEKRLSV